MLSLPSLFLDVVNPLSPYWLAVTTFFEIGVGLAYYLGFVIVAPRLKKRGELEALVGQKLVWRNRLVDYFAWMIPNKNKVFINNYQPVHFKTWVLFKFSEGAAWLALGLVTFFIATSVGLINHTDLDYTTYLLLYARATGEMNGAHIFSYLGVGVIGIIAAVKYRDIYFGALCSGWLGAVHEGIWVALYYIAYWQYLDWSLLTSVLKDVSFVTMMLLLALSFWKYPYRPISVRSFKVPIILFTGFLLAWFFVPHLIRPDFYGWLPITTINNWKFGVGVYSMTPWYWDNWTNALEVIGWVFPFLMFSYVLLGAKR